MKLVKIIFISLFVLCLTQSKAQFIVAGQVGANDYYHDVNPDTTKSASGNSAGAIVTFSIDLNGDGTTDFDLVGYKGPGMGNPGGDVHLTPKNNNQVLKGNTATCSFSNTAYCPYVGTESGITALALNNSYTIKDSLNGWQSAPIDIMKEYCCYRTNFISSASRYLAVRLITLTDTLYGWIGIRICNCPSPTFTIEDFACSKPKVIAPASNFSVNSSSACTGDQFFLTDQSSNSPTGWSWSSVPSSGVMFNTSSSQNPQVTFSVSGTYSVSLTASNSGGVGSTSVKIISVNSCVGIKEQTPNDNFSVFPNPVKDELTVITSSALPIKAVLMDLSGKTLIKETLQPDQKLNISELSPGIYLLKLFDGNTSACKKIIRE